MLASEQKQKGRWPWPPCDGPKHPRKDSLTVHVQVLGFVLQRHHLLGFAGHGLEPPQASSRRPLLLLGCSVSQQVVQVVGQIVGLWTVKSERGGGGQGQELRTRDTVG